MKWEWQAGFPSKVVEVSFLGDESRKKDGIQLYKRWRLVLHNWSYMFWMLTGLNMTVVAFVSHFFPLLQLMLAKDDLSYLLSSTFIKHRGKQSFFCSPALESMNWSTRSNWASRIHSFMHPFIHSLTYTLSVSIHWAFILYYVLGMLIHPSHDLRPQGIVVQWLRETSIEKTITQCSGYEKEESPGCCESPLGNGYSERR